MTMRSLSVSILSWLVFIPPLVAADNLLSNRDARTVTVYATAPTSAPSTSYTTQSALVASALNSTNHFRAQHGAIALTWNKSLANAASSWASKCQWRHSGDPTGENLALGYPEMASAVDAWGNERDLYDFSLPTGFSEETAHFTQLVWKDTTSVGCAAVDCSGKNSLKGYLVVCEYWPAGNVVGQGNAFFRASVQERSEAEAPRSSGSVSRVSASSTRCRQPPLTPTVTPAISSAEFMATSTRAKSTACALREEAAADQPEAKSRVRWAVVLATVAIVVAAAIG